MGRDQSRYRSEWQEASSGEDDQREAWWRTTLVQVAWVASRSKGTRFQRQYTRQSQRLGRKKALVALAHRILVVIDTLLKQARDYEEPQTRVKDAQRETSQGPCEAERLAGGESAPLDHVACAGAPGFFRATHSWHECVLGKGRIEPIDGKRGADEANDVVALPNEAPCVKFDDQSIPTARGCLRTEASTEQGGWAFHGRITKPHLVHGRSG